MAFALPSVFRGVSEQRCVGTHVAGGLLRYPRRCGVDMAASGVVTMCEEASAQGATVVVEEREVLVRGVSVGTCNTALRITAGASNGAPLGVVAPAPLRMHMARHVQSAPRLVGATGRGLRCASAPMGADRGWRPDSQRERGAATWGVACHNCGGKYSLYPLCIGPPTYHPIGSHYRTGALPPSSAIFADMISCSSHARTSTEC